MQELLKAVELNFEMDWKTINIKTLKSYLIHVLSASVHTTKQKLA